MNSATMPPSCGPVPRFTLDGSGALETRLAGLCRQVMEGVQALVPASKLEAVVLGGGYGRSQGGVLKTDTGDRPYNDLEFYVFLRGNRLINDYAYRERLQALGARLSPQAGLHVEFKCDSLARLRRSPVSMFTYDLLAGHRLLHGGPEVFHGCEHHLLADRIPLAEATRLLFNRCTGLLLAKERLNRCWVECRVSGAECRGPGSEASKSLNSRPSTLEQPFDASTLQRFNASPPSPLTPEQADFIGRNLAKTQLALGDAVLTAFGRYHWSCLERQRRLTELPISEPLPWLDEVRLHHTAGVEFKLHPHSVFKAPADFKSDHRQISALALQVWLWLESRRLQCPFASARDYTLANMNKCPGTSAWRNCLLTLKTFGPQAALDAKVWRYPRERLLNALPLLLWNGRLSSEPALLRHLQRQLRTDASDWTGLVTAYKRVWASYG